MIREIVNVKATAKKKYEYEYERNVEYWLQEASHKQQVNDA
jgi:hypothetical protein